MADSLSLRVLTYNIHRAIGLDRRFRPDRIVEIVSHHAPHIALLQEVDEGAPRSRELHLARELAGALGYPHYAMGHNVTLRKGRYGNATLSQFPIVRERNIDLSVDRRKRRGCQHTTVEIEIGAAVRQVEIFNLHLGLAAREREQQVGLLVRSREFREFADGGPCLVGGDFNDWFSRLRPIFTEILGFRSATDRTTGRGQAIRTYPSFAPRGALDRIYYRGGLHLCTSRACRLNTSRVASDHLPVIVELTLQADGGDESAS
jgi:endonuclease/exonuclease/phosphatase family metal-dependent hydrolase